MCLDHAVPDGGARLRLGGRESAARSFNTAWRSANPERAETVRFRGRFEKLQSFPQLRDVATDQQDRGSEGNLVIDRDTASRLGFTAWRSITRSTTPLGSGRCRPYSRSSTSITWCSRLRRSSSRIPGALSSYLREVDDWTQVPLSAFTHLESSVSAAGGESSRDTSG